MCTLRICGWPQLAKHSPDSQPLPFCLFPQRVLQDLEMYLPGSASLVTWAFLASSESCKIGEGFPWILSSASTGAYVLPQPLTAPTSCLPRNLTELKAILEACKVTRTSRWHSRKPILIISCKWSPSCFALLPLSTVPSGSSKIPLRPLSIHPLGQSGYSGMLLRYTHGKWEELVPLHLLKYSVAMTAAALLLGVCGG